MSCVDIKRGKEEKSVLYRGCKITSECIVQLTPLHVTFDERLGKTRLCFFLHVVNLLSYEILLLLSRCGLSSTGVG